MAQLAIAAVGAALGNAFIPPLLGISGAGIGWALGSALGATLTRPRQQKPPVGDLSAPELQYGAPLPRVWGTIATAGSLAWMSDKRATEETAEVGKGGGDTVTTGYSYSADMMFVVAAESGDGLVLTRVWRNGKLVYSRRAGATGDTYVQSDTTDVWDDIELRDGNAAQTPWPIYEAAVGTADALAYRRRATVCITNARFGNSPTPPAYLFEIATEATAAPGDVFWLLNFDGTVGATTATDTSSWAHSVTLADMEQSAYAAFGATGAANKTLASGSFGTSTTSASVGWAPTQNLTLEGWVRFAGSIGNGNFTPGGVTLNTADALSWTVDDDVAPDVKRVTLRVFGQSSSTVDVAAPDYPVPTAAFFHWAIDWQGSTKTATLYINGAAVLAHTYSAALPAATSITGMTAGAGPGGAHTAGDLAIDGVRFTRNVRRYTANFTPPASPPTDDSGNVYTPGTADLQDVVRDLCTAAPPLAAAVLDTAALSGVAVRGFAAVGSPRQALEQLASAYYFGCTSDSKLKFKRRGGASAATIAYADLGAGVGQAAEEPIGLTRGNDREIPRKLALSYSNWNADHEQGTVTGDRGAGSETQVDTAELAMVLTPAEAQVIADAWAMDRRAAATTLKPAVTDYYAALECTDVVTLTDSDGSTYRARIVAEDYAGGVKALECVLDDASVFTQPGLASDYATPTISLALASDTTLRLLDIPLLRDADNDAGYYYAVARSNPSGAWSGATVNESADGTSYAQVAMVTSEAVMGTATTVLAAWTGGNVMDHANSVTISINGTASSYTDDQLLAGSARAWLIGDEILYARTATLVSPGVYTLSNLLRYQRGTEWAVHAAGERVVALDAAKLRRGPREAAQIGLAYSFKAPSFGRSLAATSAQSFTDTGEALRPLAPASVEVARDGSNNATLTVRRRTRLSHRFLAAGIDTPLGESSEAYSVDVYSSGAYTTVVRTLTASGTNVLTYSAANQTSDGLTPGATLYLAAYQVSATVGRGHSKRAAA